MKYFKWFFVLTLALGIETIASAQAVVLQNGHNLFYRSAISAVQFSPDGRWLASATRNEFLNAGQLLIWNYQKRVWAREDSLPSIQDLDWSSDGHFLALADDEGAKIWSRDQAKIIAATTWNDQDASTFNGVAQVKFLDNSRVAVVLGEGNKKDLSDKPRAPTLQIWDWKSNTKTILKTLASNTYVQVLAVSPDRKTLAMSSDGVEIFDLANGKSRSFKPMTANLYNGKSVVMTPRDLKFSPNSRFLVGFLELEFSSYATFDVAAGEFKSVRKIAGHRFSRAYNLDNDGNISWMMRQEGENDISFLVEHLQNDKLISRVRRVARHLGLSYQTVVDLQNQQFVAIVNNGDLCWFDATTGLQTHVSPAATQWANAVAFSPDGARLVVGYGAELESEYRTVGDLAIFDARKGALVQGIVAHSYSDAIYTGVGSVAFSPDGKHLITTGDGYYDKHGLRVLDAHTLRLLRDISLPNGRISEMTFSRAGKSFAIGTHNLEVLFWKDFSRVRTGIKPDWVYKGSPRPFSDDPLVYSVEISPDGKTVLAGFDGGQTAILNARNGSLIHKWFEGSSVSGAVFSNDSQTFWTGNDKGTVKEWSAKTYALRRTIQKNGDACNDMALSRDQQHLYVALGKAIVAFNIQTGRREIVFDAAPQQINALAIAPDGKTLASADEFGTAQIYDAKTGKRTHVFNRTSWERDKNSFLTTRTVTQMPNGKFVISQGNQDAILQRVGDLMKPLP